MGNICAKRRDFDNHRLNGRLSPEPMRNRVIRDHIVAMSVMEATLPGLGMSFRMQGNVRQRIALESAAGRACQFS